MRKALIVIDMLNGFFIEGNPLYCGEAARHAIVRKKCYSGFYGTDLERVLARAKAECVEVVGVCTDICVLYTVQDLRNRDYKMRVYAGGVTSFDQKAHEFALKQTEVVLAAEVVRNE